MEVPEKAWLYQEVTEGWSCEARRRGKKETWAMQMGIIGQDKWPV
jgi:hypothetical protein